MEIKKKCPTCGHSATRGECEICGAEIWKRDKRVRLCAARACRLQAARDTMRRLRGWEGERRLLKCAFCGKDFEIHFSEGRRKVCSPECRRARGAEAMRRYRARLRAKAAEPAEPAEPVDANRWKLENGFGKGEPSWLTPDLPGKHHAAKRI